MNIYDIIRNDNPSETLKAIKDEDLILLFTKLISVIEDLEDRVRVLEGDRESSRDRYDCFY